MSESLKQSDALDRLFSGWDKDRGNIKKAFLLLMERLQGLGETVLELHARPSVSYSLRASLVRDTRNRLFALVDVIDDSEERWLSVCFYEHMIRDPLGLGEAIPGGILGEDGYCFHVTEEDEALLSYLLERIGEAYQSAFAL